MLCLRTLAALVLIGGLAPFAGCTMCPSPDTDAYPTYGGIWQRTDRYHGRVGSVFEPAGAKVTTAETLAAPELVPPGQPTPADDGDDAASENGSASEADTGDAAPEADDATFAPDAGLFESAEI